MDTNEEEPKSQEDLQDQFREKLDKQMLGIERLFDGEVETRVREWFKEAEVFVSISPETMSLTAVAWNTNEDGPKIHSEDQALEDWLMEQEIHMGFNRREVVASYIALLRRVADRLESEGALDHAL